MSPRAQTITRYLVGGLLIGGFWYLNRAKAPWQEALRTISVFAVILLVLRARLKRKSVELHFMPLLASKAALVAVAAVVEIALTQSIPDPALAVSIGLGLAVALLGPLGDRHFFTRAPKTTFAGDAR